MAIEQHAAGEERVSLTLTHKDGADRVVCQISGERWFADRGEATHAIGEILRTLAELHVPLPPVLELPEREALRQD